MDYVKDSEKKTYCSNNKELDVCKCIFPPPQILQAFNTSPNPYYCFYARCKSKDAILTSLIEEGIKRCTILNCTINIGDLEIKGTTIIVKNKCINEINISDYFKVFDLNFKTDYFIKIPLFFDIKAIIFLIILIFILINIKY